MTIKRKLKVAQGTKIVLLYCNFHLRLKKMDKELKDLAKKMSETKDSIPSMSNNKCIKHFYDDIEKLLELRTLKALAEELNKNGFIIKYEVLKSYLSKIRKDKNGLKTSSKSKPENVKSSENLKAEKKQDVKSNNQAVIDSEKSVDDIAKSYCNTPKPLFKNKENKS